MMMLGLVVLAALAGLQHVNAETTVERVDRIFKEYDPDSHGSDEAVFVKLGVYINSIILDEDQGTLLFKLYLRQSYTDTRLQKYFEGTPSSVKQVKFKNDMVRKYFWLPDTFVRNALDTHSHETANTYEALFRVNRTGEVWYVHSLSMKLACPNLRKTYSVVSKHVVCPVMFESYSYTKADLNFGWLDEPVDVDKDATLLNYHLENVKTVDCSQNYTAGAFPCLEIQFNFERSMGSMLLDIGVYIISFILLVISWYAFWLHPHDQLLPRLALGVGVVLTLGVYSLAMVTWYGRNGAGSYALSVWLLGCWVLSLLPLLQFGLVYVAFTLVPNRISLAKGGEVVADKGEEAEAGMKSPRCVAVLDVVFGILVLPLIFIIFNLAYWPNM
jgi:hypothetical protein